MITEPETKCPICHSKLLYFDRTKRIVRTKGRNSVWIYVNRMKCSKCGSIHRSLPNYILPYKQYEAELIKGVIEGLITSDTLGYEDYPCEGIMNLWRRNV